MGRAAVLVLCCAGALACNRGSNGEQTANRAANAVGDLGQAAAAGAASVGHGVTCAARELGQTLSGTQGNPQAEALSKRACDRAAQNARNAEQSVQQMDQQLGVSPAPAQPQPSQGGGPKPH